MFPVEGAECKLMDHRRSGDEGVRHFDAVGFGILAEVFARPPPDIFIDRETFEESQNFCGATGYTLESEAGRPDPSRSPQCHEGP